MLQINKLLFILTLSQFLFACDDITPDPLVSSPDMTLTDSVLVSAQVATGETVTYTFPALNGILYEIRVKRAGGSDPQVLVCDIENCASSVGFEFPDINDTFDGTIIWYTATSAATLYIYVGDVNGAGDESQYSITARTAPTNTEGTALTADDIYGVVNLGETANYTLAVTATVTETQDYQVTATADIGAIDPLRACLELDCTTPVTFTQPYTADFTGTLYIFVDSPGSNSLFHINATEVP